MQTAIGLIPTAGTPAGGGGVDGNVMTEGPQAWQLSILDHQTMKQLGQHVRVQGRHICHVHETASPNEIRVADVTVAVGPAVAPQPEHTFKPSGSLL